MGKAGDTAKGAASGAATGAAIGSVVPGWGTAIGAGIGAIGGGIAGYLSSEDEKPVDVRLPNYGAVTNSLGAIAGGAQDRRATQAVTPQMGPAYQLDPRQMAQSRVGMLGTANQLGQIVSGQTAGAGELAVNRQVSGATAAQHAAARMARGSNAALAYRAAARNTADIGLAGAGQAAQAQASDQQAANAQLGQLYGSMYGQDANVATQNAQLGQQAMIEQARMGQATALANLQAQIAQTGMNDAQQMAALQQILGWDKATVDARLGKAQLPVDPGIAPSLLQAGGQALAAYGAFKSNTPTAAAPAAAPAGYAPTYADIRAHG